MFNNYLVIINASREGARSAAVGCSDVEIADTIAYVTATLDQTKVSISVHPAETLRKKGDEVIVTVEYDNSLFTPIVSALVPNPMHLTGRTVMRME
jgi:hypothetical protein